MNLSSPITSLVPGQRGRVLQALVRAMQPLSLRELARRAESANSPSTVKVVVEDLIAEGMVSYALTSKGGNFFVLNREHLLVKHLLEMDLAKDTTLDAIREEVASWEREPRAVVLFGSVARAEDSARSDIDLLVVWKGETAPSDNWVQAKSSLTKRILAMTGNSVSFIDFPREEWAKALEGREPLLDGIVKDGVPVTGTSVHTLTQPTRKATTK